MNPVHSLPPYCLRLMLVLSCYQSAMPHVTFSHMLLQVAFTVLLSLNPLNIYFITSEIVWKSESALLPIPFIAGEFFGPISNITIH